MDVLITTRSQKIPGPELEINCPKCGASRTSAASYEQRDALSLFFIIPLFTVTNTFVKCAACGAKLTSRLSIDELQPHSAAEVSPYLSHEVSFVVKFLAIASILLFIAPIVGLVLAVLTVILSLRSGGWPRTLGIVALVLSGFVTISLFVLLAAAG
jgi:hypothetical protein